MISCRVHAGARGDPLIIDSDPIPCTQGRIQSSDKKAFTVEAELLPGYKTPTGKGGIRLFDPNGVPLPHTGDQTHKIEDLGKPWPLFSSCCSS